MRKDVCLAVAVFAGVGVWGFGSGGPAQLDPPGGAKLAPALARRPDAAPIIRAAQDYAKVVSGKGSGPEYLDALEHALQGAAAQQRKRQRPAVQERAAPLDVPQVMPPARGGAVSPFAQARVKALTAAGKLADVRLSATWQKNRARYFTNILLNFPPRLQIVGGDFTLPDEVPECVAVGGATEFCCSGAVIGPNVVLTAAHCRDECGALRVFVGNESNAPTPDRVFAVKTVVVHPGYKAGAYTDDLAVLILEKRLGVTPAPFAATADIEAAASVRLVGYGVTHDNVLGVQAQVDVFYSSVSCSGVGDPLLYKCHEGKEFVAGGNGYDSCSGDSGGPAFVIVGERRHLAGAISRPSTFVPPVCGNGGVCVRVDKYRDWIVQSAVANGGEIP